MTLKEIQERAEALLKDFEEKVKPKDLSTDIVSFAKYYGFEVFQTTELNSDNLGLIMISDKLKKKYKTNKVIIINAKSSALRQIFTIADALGHYFLHFDDELERHCIFVKKIVRGIQTAEGVEALRFAENILMPKEKVLCAMDYFIKSHGGNATAEDTRRFAQQTFLVPEATAIVRLYELGWLNL